MNMEVIEVAVEKYVNERMEHGRQRAAEHFLAYAHVKHGGSEIREFMRKVRGLSRYYIEFLRVMENPFKGPEVAFCAAMVMVGIYSCYLMGTEEKRLLGMLVFSTTVFHLVALLRMTAQKWSEIGVKIAIYREIAEIADSEMA